MAVNYDYFESYLDGGDHTIACIRTKIDSDREKRIRLEIYADDGVKAWLNGELVHDNWVHRIVESDNDRVPVSFRKGKNQLVLKVQNVIDPWGFCCRLLDE